ncbi:hypothetical protein RGF97_19620 [Streptomyces roseicoloratus]|uniref:Uncharacterized protein n=1 Tax=Streptomyces roseicoloratus TaxID=2508722 RepID=A0ABY9RWQ0_9ACTN|nr:hypothetical protein [Streptomyces roseicoloratus]WMX46596.1 hypothetical protein RGF97_19620 [Streptomyces roseicoloratus]
MWVHRGETPPIRIKADRSLRPPYEEHELAALPRWMELLPDRARLDGLALKALPPGADWPLASSMRYAATICAPCRRTWCWSTRHGWTAWWPAVRSGK